MSGKGLFSGIERVVKYLTNVLMALNLILILSSVFFRYVLKNPLVWSEELAKFLLVWTVFLAASTSIKNWDNLTVTFLTEKFSPKTSRMADMVIKTIAFVFIVFLFVLAMKAIPNVWGRERAPALGITMVIPQLGVIVGLSLMILQFIGLFVEIFRTEKTTKRSKL